MESQLGFAINQEGNTYILSIIVLRKYGDNCMDGGTGWMHKMTAPKEAKKEVMEDVLFLLKEEKLFGTVWIIKFKKNPSVLNS